MKYFYATIFILGLFFAQAANAQGLGNSSGNPPSTSSGGINPDGSQNNCEPITTAAQYARCCNPTIGYGLQPYSCEIYQIQTTQQEYCRTNPDRCRSILGLPGTLPPGSTQSTTSSTDTNSGAGIISPSAGSSELASCTAIRFKSVLDILIWVKCVIVSAIIPLIFTLALLFFLWGIVEFMATQKEDKRKEAKKRMLWGIIGIFVMVSLWGIIKILGNTLGIESTVPLLQTEYLDPNKASR